MELNEYIERHEQIEGELKAAITKTNKIAAAKLLLALKLVSSKEKSMITIKYEMEKIFADMYGKDVYNSIVNFGDDMLLGNIKWESNIYGSAIKYDQELKDQLFGKTLISTYSLKNWLLRAAYKDSQSMIKIIKQQALEDLPIKQVEKLVYKQFKSSLNNIRKLMDAIAFSALFIVRDKMMKKNKIELMQWISIMDRGTTEGCIARDGLLYVTKNNSPYKHDIPWKVPGVYHWGCRSFMIPYKE